MRLRRNCPALLALLSPLWTKTEVITTEYLTGWSWRVRAISSTVGGPWSEDRKFNVAPVTSCN
ncbi:MAG: hypothetical protein OEU84_15660 [Xanthomonadales bacterium]|nr:hypothetical protein [Xanthomonadales bacterium]